jgi:hypothetical protein
MDNLQVDESFLSWVAARTNGTNVHDSNMLLSNYKWYSRDGNRELAEVTKRMLTRFLLSQHGNVRNMIGGDRHISLIDQFLTWERQQGVD